MWLGNEQDLTRIRQRGQRYLELRTQFGKIHAKLKELSGVETLIVADIGDYQFDFQYLGRVRRIALRSANRANGVLIGRVESGFVENHGKPSELFAVEQLFWIDADGNLSIDDPEKWTGSLYNDMVCAFKKIF